MRHLAVSGPNKRLSQSDVERDVDSRVHRIAQVIHAVNLDHKNVLRVEPVAWPLVYEPEPIAAVLEAAIPAVVGLVDTKRVFPSKIGPETVVGNAGGYYLQNCWLRMLAASASFLLSR